MMRACVFAVLLIGCRDKPADIRRAPERELPRAPAPAPPPSVFVKTLIGYAGEEVSVAGRVTAAVKPRIKWSVAGKSSTMVDLTDSHSTIAAHVQELPDCTGEVLMTGKVIVARGMIRQGSTEGDWAEPQLDVTRWNCR
jgi:hypothetical protein